MSPYTSKLSLSDKEAKDKHPEKIEPFISKVLSSTTQNSYSVFHDHLRSIDRPIPSSTDQQTDHRSTATSIALQTYSIDQPMTQAQP
jgi:DNA primase